MAQPFNCLTVNNRVFFNTFLQLHPGVIKVIFFQTQYHIIWIYFGSLEIALKCFIDKSRGKCVRLWPIKYPFLV